MGSISQWCTCYSPTKPEKRTIRHSLSSKKLLSQGIHIRPDTILTDFEVGLIQAIELNFPTASLTGCYLHFTQALWRKIQGVGLQTEYCAENSEVAPFFRKVAALAFVPLAFVRVAWQGLQVKYYSSLHNIYI